MLLHDPRTSFSKIGDICGLSTPAILHRFNSLNKSGIINGSIMQIDPKSLGYNRIGLLIIEADPKRKDTLSDSLKQQNIGLYRPHLTGRNSILGFIATKNTEDLDQRIHEIKKNPEIRHIEPIIWVNAKNIDHPNNLIIHTIPESSNQEECACAKISLKRKIIGKVKSSSDKLDIEKKKNAVPFQPDAIDFSIIKILVNDARIPLRKIAELLGISFKKLSKRYERLRNYVLTFSSITLNLKKLGYMGTGVLFIKINDGFDTEESLNQIEQIPNVIVTIRLFGDFEILALIPFRTFEELENKVSEINKLSFVNGVDLKIDKPFIQWPKKLISTLIINEI